MRLLIAAAGLALSLGSASAATPAQIDLSSVRCEMPEITAAIRKSVRNMRLEDGTPMLNYVGNNSGLKATTISAARDKLVCRVTINMMGRGGQSIDFRGRYTLRVGPGNKPLIEFLPGY